MSRALDKVREFHVAFGLPVREVPEGDIPEGRLRYELIKEELLEYFSAMTRKNVVGIADALGDLLYVVYGAALAHGIPIDEVFEEVHRSNMTKLGEDGKPIVREDGKRLKGPNYRPPEIEPILDKALLVNTPSTPDTVLDSKEVADALKEALYRVYFRRRNGGL